MSRALTDLECINDANGIGCDFVTAFSDVVERLNMIPVSEYVWFAGGSTTCTFSYNDKVCLHIKKVGNGKV